MEVDVSKQNLTINKLVSTKTKTITIEGDMIVPDVKPDILNTIDSVGNISIYKKEVLEGKVRFDGGINVYVIYLPESEEEMIRGLNTTLDFTQMIEVEDCNSDMDVISEMNIKNIECKVLNGRKINIKAEIEMQLQVYSNETIDVLKEINNVPNIQVLNSNMSINTLIGRGETKAYAKDTISYEETDNLAEILKVEVKIRNKEIKTSYNKVLLKADACTKVMYLTEDGNIKMLNSNIPVMGFIDIANISEENMINSNYEIKNIIIKPNGNEQHSIYIEIEVGINCRAYGTSNIELIQDMYSVAEEEINFTTKSIETENNKMTQREVCNIEERVSIPEIANNKIYDVEITPIINNINVLNKRIVYEGEVSLNFIYSSNMTTGIDTKKYTLPFNFEAESESIHPGKRILTQTECIGDNFVILSDGTIDCKLNIVFQINMSDSTNINIIDEVKIAENRNYLNYSIIVYIVKSGDTLWNIAKRYKTTVENIMELNCLENDKLNIGDKLYIQRYRNNKIGITA